MRFGLSASSVGWHSRSRLGCQARFCLPICLISERDRVFGTPQAFAPIGFATDCHRLQPRGSIKAPSDFASSGYCPAGMATGCNRRAP